jgi:hypothetical protein
MEAFLAISAVYWSAGILPAMAGFRIGELASAEAGNMPTHVPARCRRSSEMRIAH